MKQRKRKAAAPLLSLGTLKLPSKDVERFSKALDFYGFERVSAFLRICAYELIRCEEEGHHLTRPLRLWTPPDKAKGDEAKTEATQNPTAPKKDILTVREVAELVRFSPLGFCITWNAADSN